MLSFTGCVDRKRIVSDERSSLQGNVLLKRNLSGFVLLLIVCLFSQAVLAGSTRLYRYEDEMGRTVLDDHVPKSIVRKGYTVLNERGFIIKVVEPALSEERLAELAKENTEKLLREKALKKLLKTYSGPEDAELARARQLALLDSQINVKKGVIARLTGEKRRKNELAAEAERRGLTLRDDLLEDIARLERQIVAAEEGIKQREIEKIEVSKRFSEDIKSLNELLNHHTDSAHSP